MSANWSFFMPELSLLSWLLLGLGAFSVGLSKTGVPGIGILNVAIFALVLPSAKHSVGVVLPILISADIVAVLAYRRQAVWHHLWRLFPWAIAGIIIGFFAVSRVNDRQVAQLIGAILLTLVALTLWRKWKTKESADAPSVSPVYTGIMGIAGGFTTMVGNAAGPIMTLYLLAMRLPKMEFIGTGAWYFLLLNWFKVPFMMQLGWIDKPSLLLSLRLMPFAVCGALFGRAIVRYIDQNWFERIAIALTVVAAIKLVLA
ncbi:MAG TPA: sulfite exporter TauE/SafE family protein [Abditibacteriaceae bacterium]